MSTKRSQYLTSLHKFLVNHFNEGELQTLSFELDVDYDDLPGDGKANKARELVTYLERRNRTSELVTKIEEKRPDIPFLSQNVNPQTISQLILNLKEIGLPFLSANSRFFIVGGGILLIACLIITAIVWNPDNATDPEPTASSLTQTFTHSYTGQVIDSLTGKSIQDAVVFVKFPNIPISNTDFRSDAKGTVNLIFESPSQQIDVIIHISAHDYQPYNDLFSFTLDNSEPFIARMQPMAQNAVNIALAEETPSPSPSPKPSATATPEPTSISTSPTPTLTPTGSSVPVTPSPSPTAVPTPTNVSEERTIRFDTIPLGVSIGSPYLTASTLGAKVIDNETNAEMILGLWSSLAGSTDSQIGDPIWQPGKLDGGTSEDSFATLTRFILGPYDAAVATLNGERQVSTETLEGLAILCATEPKLGMRVWKSGRTTGYTEGFIDGIEMTTIINYGGDIGTIRLSKVIRIVPLPDSDDDVDISAGGDSGSIWVDAESGMAVGLHFAGNVGNTPEHALAFDINPVIQELDVHFPDCN